MLTVQGLQASSVRQTVKHHQGPTFSICCMRQKSRQISAEPDPSDP